MRVKSFLRIVIAGILFWPHGLTAERPPGPTTSSGDDPKLAALEEKFRAVPDPANLRAYMKRLSARPHHLGSAYGKQNAEWMAEKFREWGFDAKLESFEVLFPSPVERLVEMVAPTRFRAGLEEPTLPEDPSTGQKSEQLPTYNAYSADGDVTAELVFVNYGIPADYEHLERLGISVKGKIVIAKYGGSWRGIKPKVAAEHGAIGCLIYSDPAGDGYFRGDEYPKGAWRRSDGVQRGSVMDMPLYPGDPLTPGIGAVPGAKRLDRADVKTFTAIPVLPISHADALPLLRAMDGPVAPTNWRGALPMTYHIGPGPARVHLKVRAKWEMKEIYNVVARMEGAVYPDEWIIRGNHHDAWVNGAQDPISGMVALMEEARGIGELAKQGWRPKRTLIYAGWDAEEQGLIGSTEWAETHADELRQNAVVYINTDSNGRGFLSMGGSHVLEKFVNEVAKDIKDPETGLSVWRRKQLRDIANARPGEARQKLRARKELRLGALGSGSDYTVFLDHLGISSLNMAYFGEGGGGSYHSIYDTFHWYTNFSDTEFVYGRALAQTTGTAVLRLSEAEVLPFHYTNVAETVAGYLNELRTLAGELRDEILETNQLLDEGAFAATTDPEGPPTTPPSREDVPPHFNFAPLENSVDRLERQAAAWSKALSAFLDKNKAAPAGLNKILYRSERHLTHEDGLPNRSWFRHQLYAPGFYTGYGVKTLPIVRESLEQKEWDRVNDRIEKLARVLAGYAEQIAAATALLEVE